jgi:cell wall-associated NlpC family hydrolase
MSCVATIGPWTGGTASKGDQQAAALDSSQRAIAGQIIAIGKQRPIPARGWQVAIQAGMTESGLHNDPGGDRDSAGIFQMRPSQGWGTYAQVTDPTYEINKFYDVLLAVPNWQTMRPGAAAQAVERSAFPDRYNNWELMAASLVSNLGGVTDPSGCGVSLASATLATSPVAAKAIAFALSQQGKPYVWGATGPDAYDCSGLMLTAYRAAGITLPRVASDQFGAGARLPVRNAQPGDLMFLATDPSNPNTIHHVFMYLGNNQIVEAPFQGHPVHVTGMPWTDPELVQVAVRPGVAAI